MDDDFLSCPLSGIPKQEGPTPARITRRDEDTGRLGIWEERWEDVSKGIDEDRYIFMGYEFLCWADSPVTIPLTLDPYATRPRGAS